MKEAKEQDKDISRLISETLVKRRGSFVIFSVVFMLLILAGTPQLVFNGGLDIFFSEDDPSVVLFDEIKEQYSGHENVVFLFRTEKEHLFNKEDINSLSSLHSKADLSPYNTKVSSIINYEYIASNENEIVITPLFNNPVQVNDIDLKGIKEKINNDSLAANFLINKKGSVAIIVVELADNFDPTDPKQLKEVVMGAQKIKQEVEANNQEISVYLNGSVIVLNQSQQAIGETFGAFLPLTIIIMFLLLFFLFRSVGLVFAILTINITAALGCVGAGAWFGVELNMLSTTAVILTLIIANVDTLHISTTYLKELKNGLDKEDAMSISLQRNFTAILLTSLTTIGGFLGFNFVGVAGISDLGNFTMLGVTVAFVLSFTLFPTLALKWSNPDPARGLDQEKISKAITDFSLVYRRPLFVFFILLVIGFAPFAAQNRFNDDLLNYFDDDTELGQAWATSVEEMGAHKTIEYVIDSGSENGVYNPDYMNQVDQFVTWYSAQPNVTKIISFTDILKRINQVMHNDDPQWNRVPDSIDLASQYTLLYGFSAETEDLIKDDNSALHLTVILDHMDDREFLALESKAQQWFTSRYPETGFQGTSFDSMLTKAGETTVIGMKKGFLITLLFVTLVMILGLRSVKYGLISLIPNLIPGLVVYGIWGVFVGEMGQHVALAYALSLGLVIDDTAHILVKYMHSRKGGCSPERAANYALENSAVAVIMSTLIFGGGVLVFNIAELLPLRDEGNVLASIFFFALAFDLFVLPSLLIFIDNLFIGKNAQSEQNGADDLAA